MIDNPTFPANYHHHCHLTYDLLNQPLVSKATKSVGEEYGFTQELFNALQQINKFFTFIFFTFLLPCWCWRLTALMIILVELSDHLRKNSHVCMSGCTIRDCTKPWKYFPLSELQAYSKVWFWWLTSHWKVFQQWHMIWEDTWVLRQDQWLWEIIHHSCILLLQHDMGRPRKTVSWAVYLCHRRSSL